MADNTKIGPIFRGANGGLSDDLFTGIKNSFYYSNDMEIREDAKSIYPKKVPAYADPNTRKLIPDTEQDIVNVTYSTEGDGERSGWLVCTRRKIYIVNNQGVTQLCEMPEDIKDLEIFNGYIYISTQNYLYYKRDNGLYWTEMAASTGATDDDYGRCDDTFTSTGHHPLYGTGTILVVGDGSVVRKVNKETFNILEEGFSLQKEYYATFIDEMGAYVRVTANNAPYGSEVLLWDKVSSAPTEIISLEGYHIIQSCVYNGYHYLLSDKGLGLLNGYQYYILKKAVTDINSSTRNGMVVFDDKLFFVANEGIYIYGAKNKNYADVLNLWHKVEGRCHLGAIGANENQIMITRNKGYIDGVSTQAYVGWNEGLAETGEVQTMCYYGASMSEIKQSMYLRVGYHIPKVTYGGSDYTGSVRVYYRTEADAIDDSPENWEWHELTPPRGLRASSDMRSPFATSLKLNCRFQWIQFKFVITNCVWQDDDMNTYTKDTNLYSADLYYNDMLD